MFLLIPFFSTSSMMFYDDLSTSTYTSLHVLVLLTSDLCNLVYSCVQDNQSCPLSLFTFVLIYLLSLCSKNVVSLHEYLP